MSDEESERGFKSEEEEEDLDVLGLQVVDGVVQEKPKINLKAALEQKLAEFAKPHLAWIETLALTSKEPIELERVDDDFARELAFYNQALAAVTEGRTKLESMKISHRRPVDYFAEMLKSDSHMNKVRTRLVTRENELANSEKRRKEREMKKFGKQVQIAKQQERQKQKRASMDAVSKWRKTRHGADDQFDVDLMEEAGNAGTGSFTGKRKREDGGHAGPSKKRQKKDEKYGRGGKTWRDKSNDRASTGDFSGFNKHKNKGAFPNAPKTGRASNKRPGKARRQQARGKH